MTMNFAPLPEDIKAKKAKIWASLESKLPEKKLNHSFTEAFELLFHVKKPSRLAMMQAKEKLFLRLQALESPTWSLRLRVGLSSLVLASMGLMILFPGSLFIPQAYALAEDQLMVESGEVLLNGLPVAHRVSLKAGDVIETKLGAKAQLYLADDSRVSLDEMTQLRFVQSSLQKGVLSQSVLEQTQGRVWVQVLNLVDSQFNLLVPDAEILVDYQASFQSKVDASFVDLRMFHSMAKVSERTLLDQDVLLVEGTSLSLRAKDWQLSAVHNQEPDSFIDFNLSLEKNYRENKLEAYQNAVDEDVMIAPGHFLYPVKRLREKVQEKVMPSPLKDKVLQSHAQERLREYHQALNKGELAEAKDLAVDFQETRNKIVSNSSKDIVEALEKQSQKLLVLADQEPLLLENKPSVDLNFAMNAMMGEAFAGEKEKMQISWDAYQGSIENYIQKIDTLPLTDREAILADFVLVKQKERLLIETFDLQDENAWQAQTLEDLNAMLLSVQTLTPDWAIVKEADNLAESKKMFEVLSETAGLDDEVYRSLQNFVKLVDKPADFFVASPESLSQSPVLSVDIDEAEGEAEEDENESETENEGAELPEGPPIQNIDFDPRFQN